MFLVFVKVPHLLYIKVNRYTWHNFVHLVPQCVKIFVENINSGAERPFHYKADFEGFSLSVRRLKSSEVIHAWVHVPGSAVMNEHWRTRTRNCLRKQVKHFNILNGLMKLLMQIIIYILQLLASNNMRKRQANKMIERMDNFTNCLKKFKPSS